MKACLPNLRPSLDSWCRNEFGSGLESWLWVFNCQFTDCLEKRDFLQTILNIAILYTVGKNFSSRVWIRDRYLKIRLRLAQIHSQSLSFLHRNTCWRSGTSVGNRGYHFDKEVKRNLLAPNLAVKIGWRTTVHRHSAVAPRIAHHRQRQRLDG